MYFVASLGALGDIRWVITGGSCMATVVGLEYTVGDGVVGRKTCWTMIMGLVHVTVSNGIWIHKRRQTGEGVRSCC
jgi:hypothetical protein